MNSLKGYKRLRNVRNGSIFSTRDGILAIKSEYYYSNDVDSQSQCILLESGEYAHFPNKNSEWVKELPFSPHGYFLTGIMFGSMQAAKLSDEDKDKLTKATKTLLDSLMVTNG